MHLTVCMYPYILVLFRGVASGVRGVRSNHLIFGIAFVLCGGGWCNSMASERRSPSGTYSIGKYFLSVPSKPTQVSL